MPVVGPDISCPTEDTPHPSSVSLTNPRSTPATAGLPAPPHPPAQSLAGSDVAPAGWPFRLTPDSSPTVPQRPRLPQQECARPAPQTMSPEWLPAPHTPYRSTAPESGASLRRPADPQTRSTDPDRRPWLPALAHNGT